VAHSVTQSPMTPHSNFLNIEVCPAMISLIQVDPLAGNL